MIGFRHEYWQVTNRFTPDAIMRKYEITQGVPRDIVLICGYAYSHALDHNLEVIEPEIIDRAAGNLTMKKDRESIAVA